MISVIIPSYNRKKYIMRSIQSVLNQTIKDIELIVVDDGSSDNTEEILLKIKDKRFKYIKLEKNMGACFARNIGIQAAKGEYIAFQDSDDCWKKNKLEKQLNALIKSNADLIFCKMCRYLKNSTKFKIVPLNLKSGFVPKERLISNPMVSTQTLFGKKECFIKEKFDISLPRLQDYELVMRLACNYLFVFLDEVLVDVYTQEDCIIMDNFKAIKAYEIIYEKHFENINRQVKINLLKSLVKFKTLENINIHNDCLEIVQIQPSFLNYILFLLSDKIKSKYLYYFIKYIRILDYLKRTILYIINNIFKKENNNE